MDKEFDKDFNKTSGDSKDEGADKNMAPDEANNDPVFGAQSENEENPDEKDLSEFEDDDEDYEDDEDYDEDEDEEDDGDYGWEEGEKRPNSHFFKGFFIGIGSIAAACLIFIIFYFNLIPNPFPGALTAVSFEKEKVSVSKFEFFYHYKYGETYQAYSSYIDSSLPFDEQTCDLDTSMTWAQYVYNETLDYLRFVLPVARQAKKEGMKLNSANLATRNDYIQNIIDNASANNMTSREYIKENFGEHCTKSSIIEAVDQILLAYQYMEKTMAAYEFTDEEITKYYEAHKAAFVLSDLFDFYFFNISFDGETVTQESAKAKADAFLAKLSKGSPFHVVAKEYVDEKYKSSYEDETYVLYEDYKLPSLANQDMITWLSDESRKTGDTTIIETSDSYGVLMFKERSKDTTPTVNVRHILIAATDQEVLAASKAAASDAALSKAAASAASDADSTAAGSTGAESAVTSSPDYYRSVYERASEIYEKWKSGDRTEESFAALAKKYSDDENSKEDGGLLKNLVQTSNEFGDWCLDPSRKPGDTTLISDEETCYIVYFVSKGEDVWQVNAKWNLAYEKYVEEVIEKNSQFEVSTNHLGYRYLDMD